MHAFYEFELVRGEDRSIPMTFWYREPETGEKLPVMLTDYEFLMVIQDKHSGKEFARLSTEDDSILLGEMNDTNESLLREIQKEHCELPVVCAGVHEEIIKRIDSVYLAVIHVNPMDVKKTKK